MILQISKLNVAMMPVVKVLAVAETLREGNTSMTKLLLILSLTFGLTTAISANEKFFTPKLIGTVQVHLSDRAVNGCWTNLKETREYAEEQLQMYGYTVAKHKLLEHPDTKETLDLYKPLVMGLPEPFSEEDRYNILLDVMQKDRFILVIEVNAERSRSGALVQRELHWKE